MQIFLNDTFLPYHSTLGGGGGEEKNKNKRRKRKRKSNKNKSLKNETQPGMVAQACDTSTREAEAGGQPAWVQVRACLQKKREEIRKIK